MGTGRQYDEKFKLEAVKLAREVGTKKAAEDLDIPKNTLGGWMSKARKGEMDAGNGSRKAENEKQLYWWRFSENIILIRNEKFLLVKSFFCVYFWAKAYSILGGNHV